MPPLPTDLRNKLERTIIEARDTAEAGARAALEALAVHHHEPYPHQTPDERQLRNRLRAHARRLSDKRDPKTGTQSINRLVHECAYEHWHRMLFARFLAENDLLIEPSMGVAISLQECEELAKEAKTDLWEYASRCAQQMLPQIFRPDDPLLRVTLAHEHSVKLERLLNSLEPDIFKADDSLGWVYQFWQSKESKRIKRSGMKIGADELPARTQLFTQPYMVDFLLHNTLGAWWAAKLKAESKIPKAAWDNCQTEDDCRKLVSLPIYEFTYLRFIKNDAGEWLPAAGTFPGWPKSLKEFKLLDPCCGSGHFLVAAFLLLVLLWMYEEKLSARDACDAVLRDNLHGLEVDPRCTQIAAFALALAAWKFPQAGGYRKLSEMHIACSGLAITATKTQWLDLAGNNAKLRNGMERLYELFENAPVLGSLIDVSHIKKDILTADMDELRPLLQQALLIENNDIERSELSVTAKGISYAAEILSNRFTLLATNVPYLLAGKQCEFLRSYCEARHKKGSADLATVFLMRCNGLLMPGGTHATVTPLNWLYINSYKDLRRHFLTESKIQCVARVGSADVAKDSWEILRALTIITNEKSAEDYVITGVEAPFPDDERKATALATNKVMDSTKNTMIANPDSRIVFNSSQGLLFKRYADSIQGIITGDIPRFTRCLWEVEFTQGLWRYQQSRVASSTYYGGREHIIMWESNYGLLSNSQSARIQGLSALGRSGLAVSIMRSLPVTLYTGEMFDSNVAAILPKKPEDVVALWTFLESPEFNESVRRIDQKLGVTNATFEKIPFDYQHWKDVALEKYPNGLPAPYSDDPTQWIFHGHPAAATDPLQVAVARLLGYRWPAETDKEMKLSGKARALVEECQELDKFMDEDGIVCIPSLRGEESALDRLQVVLSTSYGSGWAPSKEKELIAATGSNAPDLDNWLRTDFFEQHCKLFHYRPFIWHIWDGRRDGFQALVNCHKLAERDGKGRKSLESLTYSYLGDWIARQQDGVKRGENGAEGRLVAALELQKRLVAILEGEPPFDLFVRWKPLREQPIGWEPDINDGVRINIRPFLASDVPNGKKGAGILRSKPNIKWEKDRGKEPHRPKADFPWFWGWDSKTVDFMGGKEFTGERFNDCHCTVAAKLKARQTKSGGH